MITYWQEGSVVSQAAKGVPFYISSDAGELPSRNGVVAVTWRGLLVFSGTAAGPQVWFGLVPTEVAVADAAPLVIHRRTGTRQNLPMITMLPHRIEEAFIDRYTTPRELGSTKQIGSVLPGGKFTAFLSYNGVPEIPEGEVMSASWNGTPLTVTGAHRFPGRPTLFAVSLQVPHVTGSGLACVTIEAGERTLHGPPLTVL